MQYASARRSVTCDLVTCQLPTFIGPYHNFRHRVCAEIPFAGARLFETGVERILKEHRSTGSSPEI